jgi:hypothetical protein
MLRLRLVGTKYRNGVFDYFVAHIVHLKWILPCFFVQERRFSNPEKLLSRKVHSTFATNKSCCQMDIKRETVTLEIIYFKKKVLTSSYHVYAILHLYCV